MRREGPFRFSFMFVLMMAIWLVLSFGSGTAGRRLSKAEFETLLAGGDVEQVLILQNRETPTGEVRLIYKGSEGKGSRESYYVSDVNKLQEELEAKNIDFVLDNVPVNNDWLSLLLPSLITVGGCFLIFWLMQNRGGGTNAKMMNFGKSFRRKPGASGAGRRFPEGSQKIHGGGRAHPQGHHPGGAARNRKDAAREGGGRRGRRPVLFHLRFGFCRNVRRRRRVPCP